MGGSFLDLVSSLFSIRPDAFLGMQAVPFFVAGREVKVSHDHRQRYAKLSHSETLTDAVARSPFKSPPCALAGIEPMARLDEPTFG